MHRPGDAEIEDDAALKTDERRRKVLDVETRRVLGIVVFRIGAEIVGGVAGGRQRLRIADGVEDHIERIAADVSHRADAGSLVLDEGAVRDAAASAAAGLDVVDLAEFPRLYDLLDHFHILVHTGLETDRQDLAALLLGAHDLHRFLGGDAHRLFQKDVHALPERVNGRDRVLTVVGADRDRVQFLVVEQFLVARIAAHAFKTVSLEERLGFAGDQVRARDDLDVLHLLIAFDVRLGDPSGADDADLQLLSDFLLFLDLFLFELT